ncbi:MAG: GNAT family N-acetyltransferase [Actinomycetota bacterium]|nr:GNAT family N-acetyltransferase [Actinomycetota bacterium]
MRVRPANASDADDIRMAYLASWRSAYQGLLTVDVLEMEATARAEFDWMSEIRSGSSHVEVAVDDREIVGVVLASGPPGGLRDLPEITMLYVVPYWGRFGACQLLAAGIDWIAQEGWPAARLRVVEAQGRARRFYEREGWRLDAELPPAQNGFFNLVYYRRDLGP